MKRFWAILVVVLFFIPVMLSAQRVLLDDSFSRGMQGWTAVNGDWDVVGGRFVPLNARDGMTKAYKRVRQSGLMQYEFDVRYVDGGEDGYAAFGIHVNIDDVVDRKSWGNGRSYLLWVTFDPMVYGGTGFWGQVYLSNEQWEMDLLGDAYHFEMPVSNPLTGDVYLSWEYAGFRIPPINVDIPVKIQIDYRTGKVRIKDPIDPTLWWAFYLDKLDELGSGNYVALRTSSASISFDNMKVTKLR
jgi:hypothetical protein